MKTKDMHDFKRSRIIYGDAILKTDSIPSSSVDLILSDLPYGKTKNEGDVVIPPELLWPVVWRVGKPNAAVIFFGQDKFSAMMMLSDPNHRYNLIWEKPTVTGYLNAKKMPLRCHEDMMVFYKHLPTYNPQKTTGHIRKVSTKNHRRNSKKTTNYNPYEPNSYDSTERFPRSVWRFKTDTQKSSLHPNQKPVKLIEELVKTYSNKGDLVLDMTSGSGTTGVACINTERDFILIEKTEKWYNKGKNRILKVMEHKNIKTENLI